MKRPHSSAVEEAGLSRRALLVAAGSASLAIAPRVLAEERSGAGLSDLPNLGAKAAVEAIRRGELRAEAYAAHLLDRERALSGLNAMITVDPARVLEEARAIDVLRAKGRPLGAMAGLPFAVKDQMDVDGYPTTAGNGFLRVNIANRTATVAQTMRNAGAVAFGKANCADMVDGAFLLTHVTTSNPFFGFARNPYDADRVPGGSSGGNAVALAARIVPAAIGEDTGGSVRIPAALSGVVGFRPSTYTLQNALGGARRKRYPDDGMLPPAGVLDTWGPMARSVEDVAFIDSIITGETAFPVPLSKVKVGIPRPDYWESEAVDSRVAATVVETFRRLREAGAQLVEVDFQALLDLNAGNQLSRVRQLAPSQSFDDWLALHHPELPIEQVRAYRNSFPASLAAISFAPPTPPVSVAEAKAVIAKAAEAHLAFFRSNGIVAMAFPTVPVTAPLINVNGDTPGQKILVNGKPRDELATMLTHTLIGARLGAPGISLPAALSDGLPVGLELDGLPGDDLRLLGLAISVERALEPLPAPAL